MQTRIPMVAIIMASILTAAETANADECKLTAFFSEEQEFICLDEENSAKVRDEINKLKCEKYKELLPVEYTYLSCGAEIPIFAHFPWDGIFKGICESCAKPNDNSQLPPYCLQLAKDDVLVMCAR